jgi:hypothetical protein
MVNTFIPFTSFEKCAACLDNKRLGKQRVEAMQIINIITGATQTKGWRNHPVVVMWKDHPDALKMYYNAVVSEWIRRGFVNNMPLYEVPAGYEMPWFMDCLTVQMSHRGNLVRKYPEYYAQQFGILPQNYTAYSYVWPGNLTDAQKQELIQHKNEACDIRKYAVLFAELNVRKK